MEENQFLLFSQEKSITIPSNFPSLFDVNPKIYEILTKNRTYYVKSNVDDEILEQFIDNWVNGTAPDINITNISMFISISEEFDRMQEHIQLFYKINPAYNIILFTNNQTLKTIITKKNNKLNQNKTKYLKVLELFFDKFQRGCNSINLYPFF